MSHGKIVYFAFFPFFQYYIRIMFSKKITLFCNAYKMVVWSGVVISQTPLYNYSFSLRLNRIFLNVSFYYFPYNIIMQMH